MEAEIKRPQVTISAVITRTDGTVENLGVICESVKITKEDKDNG